MVSEELESAIGNFVEVFRCEPKEQAKAQLRQLIEEHPKTEAFPVSLDVYKADVKALRERIADYEKQIDALIKGNEKLLERAEKAERDLADERTARELHEGTLQMTVDRLGGMVEGRKTGRHNFLQRIDELIEKEKQHFMPKKAKKK